MSQYEIKGHYLCIDGKRVKLLPSPNHGGEIDPTLIVVHYDGTPDYKPSRGGLQWLVSKQSQVSAHFWVGKDGEIIQLLPCNVKGWHAGISEWNGESVGNSVNSFSVGIENQGTGAEWPEAQVQANIGVIVALHKAYQIEATVGHEDVAPGRKVDPGPNYPWDQVEQALKEAGIA